jgi:signal transduction histidine kinase/DNA-binding response OmpR family regulator
VNADDLRGQPPDPAGAGNLGADGPDARARVLLVDDEPSVLDVFREYLVNEGHDVTPASSGEEAVRMIPALRPDIIVTDINLPGLSGLEVMRYAKGVDPEVAVVVCTGYASASTAIDALRQGAYDYLTKPPDLFDLAQVVARGLASRRLRELNERLLEELRQKNEELKEHEATLRERVRLATLQLTRLYEIGKEIASNLELAPRAEAIASKAAEAASAEAAVLYLRNEETGTLSAAGGAHVDFTAADAGDGAADDERSPVFRAIDEKRTIRHRVAPGEEPMRLPGVRHGGFGAVLAAPMITTEEQVIGVLAVAGKEDGFTEGDENFLALLASQSAVAVRNSQLYEHTKSLDRLKSEFVAVVSHEIRTPLTSVKGAVELLSDDRYFQNGEQQTKLLTIAHANAERLLLLINDILDFSKLEAASLPMNIERQRLEPVLQQAAHNLRTLFEERRMHLDMAISPDLPDLMLDANRITQVITNLLSNAIKFSPPGGRIEVSATPWEGAVRVGVRDQGEGIATQDMPKLFRKFSQIDGGATRKTGGTGLGLVICKGIVEQHGGRIWVESTAGEGSTFYFMLPVLEWSGAESIVDTSQA